MDTLFATLTIDGKRTDVGISGKSKVDTTDELNDPTVSFSGTWMLVDKSTGLVHLRTGNECKGGYFLHKVYAITNGGKVILENYDSIFAKIKAFFTGEQ